MRRSLFCCVVLVVAAGVSAARAELEYRVVDGVGDVPLKIVTAGDAANPALLFIHGLAQSHYAFHHQLESGLAEDYYLISFDLRGHGASAKPWGNEAYGSSAVWAGDVAAVLAATGARRPLLVAWSYGTLVALDYLRETGAENIAGLLLTGAVGALVPFRAADTDEALREEFMRVRQQQLSDDPRDQVAALDRMVDWLTGTPLASDERDRMRVTAAMFPAYARRAIYARPLDNRDLLPVVSGLPVLIALGSEDNAALVEDAAILAADHAAMDYSLYEGSGHSVFLEQPDRFNRELRSFADAVFARAAAAQPE